MYLTSHTYSARKKEGISDARFPAVTEALHRRHVLAAELESTLEALRTVSALLSACPECGKPRDGAGGNGETEVAARARVHPELVGTLCTDCRTNGPNAVSTTPAGLSAA